MRVLTKELSQHTLRCLVRLCLPCLVWVHATRFQTVFVAVAALLRGQRLSAARLGRAIAGPVAHKHKIKRIDRLLGNVPLQQEQPLFYAAIVQRLLRDLPRPVLLLDWTKAVDGFYALVAAVPVDGRALPLYTQVHPEKKQGNRRVHRHFFRSLAALLPADCRPIVVMDAGFGSHVWKMLRQELSWDFVARIRGIMKVCPIAGTDWIAATSLYPQATATATDLGMWTACRNGAQGCYRLVQSKQPPKPGHRWRKAPRSGTQKSAKAAAQEPWLLATSLDTATAAQIMAAYRLRMRIEETFRDAKNHRFGWSLREARATQAERVEILLLLAALAMLLVTIVGLMAEQAGAHRAYQANTMTVRRVLSHFVLGTFILQDECLPHHHVIPFPLGLAPLHQRIREIAQPCGAG